MASVCAGDLHSIFFVGAGRIDGKLDIVAVNRQYGDVLQSALYFFDCVLIFTCYIKTIGNRDGGDEEFKLIHCGNFHNDEGIFIIFLIVSDHKCIKENICIKEYFHFIYNPGLINSILLFSENIR